MCGLQLIVEGLKPWKSKSSWWIDRGSPTIMLGSIFLMNTWSICLGVQEIPLELKPQHPSIAVFDSTGGTNNQIIRASNEKTYLLWDSQFTHWIVRLVFERNQNLWSKIYLNSSLVFHCCCQVSWFLGSTRFNHLESNTQLVQVRQD
jgi:hypothetical protein